MIYAKCDLCENIKEGEKKPHGWGSLRVSHRWSSNIGSEYFRLDVCMACTTTYLNPYAKNVRERFIKLIKAVNNVPS